MIDERNYYLIGGAVLTAIAAALHLACIFFGAPWYRFFGAGERMAELAESGSRYPAAVSSAIALMLSVWSLYALSGAAVIPRLPLLRPVLCVITAIYLLRGLAVVALIPLSLGRSTTFWWWSSAICLTIGAVHFLGLRQAWNQL
jgi:hypothetical protein